MLDEAPDERGAKSENFQYGPVVVASRRLVPLLSLMHVACAGSPGDGPSGDTMNDTSREPVTYCDVQSIFETSCQRCHGSPLRFDAPMELLTYEQVFARRVTIRSVVKSGYMPYTNSDIEPPVEPLSQDEQDRIVTWVDQGAVDCP